MKRKYMILILFFVLILVIAILCFFNQINQKKFVLERDSTIVGIFKNKEADIKVNFSSEDVNVIYDMFNEKKCIKKIACRVVFQRMFL